MSFRGFSYFLYETVYHGNTKDDLDMLDKYLTHLWNILNSNMVLKHNVERKLALRCYVNFKKFFTFVATCKIGRFDKRNKLKIGKVLHSKLS